ncbi:MAG: hypothetical protein QHC67_14125 [Sphingobium sp.]|uniref:hypothetical protein n=1 Tax=Sphingobium sp. TaxID=1912891 RepID=UPI0029B19CDD|nr:hypothetical protein [Sphingobium sp.]MDX3910937.1 hypothetical protein [Sphingobium sp.]
METGERPEQGANPPVVVEDDRHEAQRLIAEYGRQAPQYLVDRMQSALRADDDAGARRFDRISKLIQLG